MMFLSRNSIRKCHDRRFHAGNADSCDATANNTPTQRSFRLLFMISNIVFAFRFLRPHHVQFTSAKDAYKCARVCVCWVCGWQTTMAHIHDALTGAAWICYATLEHINKIQTNVNMNGFALPSTSSKTPTPGAEWWRNRQGMHTAHTRKYRKDTRTSRYRASNTKCH